MSTRTTTRVQSSKTRTPKTRTPKTTIPKTTRVQSSRKTTSISRGGKKGGANNNDAGNKKLSLNDKEYEVLSEIITKNLLKLMMKIEDETKKKYVNDYFIKKKGNDCANDQESNQDVDTDLKTIINIDCKFENSFLKKLKKLNKQTESNIEIDLTHDEISNLKTLYEEEKKIKITKNKIDIIFEKINKVKSDKETRTNKNTLNATNVSQSNKDQILENMMNNLAIEIIQKRREEKTEQSLSTKLNKM